MRKLRVPLGKTGLSLVLTMRLGRRERRAVMRWLTAVANLVARELEARTP